MLDITQIPNSIINQESTVYNDSVAPYPYLTFITLINVNSITDATQLYNEYVIAWKQTKVSNTSTTEYKDTIKEKYYELLNNINLSYTDTEERRFLTNLDLTNPLDRDILIPFYINKINDITNYFISKREELKFTVEKNKRSNSKKGFAAQLKTFIINELTQNNAYINLSDYTLNALTDDLEIDILEKYDIFPHYYDIDPETSANQYNVKDILFNKYFTNNILDYNRLAFVDEQSYLISAIREYALFITDIGFGISFTNDANDIASLKPKDFINQTHSNTVKDLNINTYKSLTQQYAGVDMHYISSFNGDTQIGKLFDATASHANRLNVKNTSIQNIPANEYVTQRNVGKFFLPNNQSVSFYNAYNKRYNLNDNISGVCIYPDPEICGNIYGTSLTQLKNYPYLWETNLDGLIYEDSYKSIAGQVNTNIYQDFTGYNTESKTCTLTHNFESIVNSGIITNYKTDIYGNEYAIFKHKQYNIPNTVNSTVLSNIVNAVYIQTVSSTNIENKTNISYIYDGGTYEQAIHQIESTITSDYYEWPDIHGEYYYDILLEAGLHDDSIRSDTELFAGFPYRPYSKTETQGVALKPANIFDLTNTKVYDKCYLYDGNGNQDDINIIYNNSIPYIPNKSDQYGTILVEQPSNNNTSSSIYERRKLTGTAYVKYNTKSTPIPLTSAFNFIDNIDNLTIQDIDVIQDVLILIHKNGLIFCKIELNDRGEFVKPSIQIKYFNTEDLSQIFFSRYFYIEKNNSVMFVKFVKENDAIIPTIYSISIEQLNLSIIYECSKNSNGEIRKFQNKVFSNIVEIDTPILVYNSLNNMFSITYTLLENSTSNNISRVVNMSFIDRLATAEIISYDIYGPDDTSIKYPKFHLLETQMIDNFNNHIFCVFETDEKKILIVIIRQVANRVIAYEQKLSKIDTTVFNALYNNSIITTYDAHLYNTPQNIILTPVSSYNIPLESPIVSALPNAPSYAVEILQPIIDAYKNI